MIRVTTRTIIDAGDIGDAAGALIGKNLNGTDGVAMSFYEAANGHTYLVEIPFIPDKWEQEKYDQEVRAWDACQTWTPDPTAPWSQPATVTPGIRVMLNKLYEAGEIEAGRYYIECDW